MQTIEEELPPQPYQCSHCKVVRWYRSKGKTHNSICGGCPDGERLVRMKLIPKIIEAKRRYAPHEDVTYIEVRFTNYDQLWHAVYKKGTYCSYDRIKKTDVELVLGWMEFQSQERNRKKKK